MDAMCFYSDLEWILGFLFGSCLAPMVFSLNANYLGPLGLFSDSYGSLSWVPCVSFGIQFGWHGIVLGSYADRMGLG